MTALVLLASFVALVPVLALALTGRGDASGEPELPVRQAIREAMSHPSYLLLTAGFFVCGFHIAFITTHLPPYLTDLGFSGGLAASAIALIGLFNVIGAYSAGVLGGHHSRKFLLSGIYSRARWRSRSSSSCPPRRWCVVAFAAAIGLLWLSTVPLTSGLVALMFGTRYVGMLFGFVFLSHQIGAFIGVWLGGVVYDATGTYDLMWWLCVALGLFAALIHLPIQERRAREWTPAAAPA